jgi:hypothetical protein
MVRARIGVSAPSAALEISRGLRRNFRLAVLSLHMNQGLAIPERPAIKSSCLARSACWQSLAF